MSRRLVVSIWVAAAAIASVAAVSVFTPDVIAPSQPSMNDASVSARVDMTNPPGANLPVAASAVPASTGVRFVLAGVVAASANDGLALISVNGTPARAFRVGSTVEGDIVVREVSARGVTLGPRDGGAAIALEVSVAAAPATGTSPLRLGEPALESGRPLYDGSAQSQDVLRKIGSKHPPLPPQSASAPTPKPGDGMGLSDGDGSWKGPSGR